MSRADVSRRCLVRLSRYQDIYPPIVVPLLFSRLQPQISSLNSRSVSLANLVHRLETRLTSPRPTTLGVSNTTMSSADSVLNTPELLEMILLHLPHTKPPPHLSLPPQPQLSPQLSLLRLQSVSTTWHLTIASFRSLQRLLFLSPAPDNRVYLVGSRRIERLCHPGCSHNEFYIKAAVARGSSALDKKSKLYPDGITPAQVNPLFLSAVDPARGVDRKMFALCQLKISVSWETIAERKGDDVMEMFLTQAPVRGIQLQVTPVRADVAGPARKVVVRVVEAGGVKLRHVVDAVEKMRLKGGIEEVLILPPHGWVVVHEADEAEVERRTKMWEKEVAEGFEEGPTFAGNHRQQRENTTFRARQPRVVDQRAGLRFLFMS